MERLHKLLFELASAERINILMKLQNNRMKLSDMSRRLDLTVTETSRHLQRLGGAKLVIREADGLYGLTPYGELALSQLAGLGFIEEYREYFLEYDVSCLPYEFVSRIGELAGSKIMADTYSALEETARVFREAQEFAWILSNKNLTLLGQVLVNKLNSSFDLKVILPKEEYPSDNEAVIKSTMPGVQEKFLPAVEFRLVVTEREAGFSLPLYSNRSSYRAFHSDSPKFYKWCKDLYLYYWEKAKPVTT